MGCSECADNKPLKRNGGNTPPVLEIVNQPEVVEFLRVDIPAEAGDDETNPPTNGRYNNVLLVYGANNHVYLYNSVGIPTRLYGTSDFDELSNRPQYAGRDITSRTSIPDIGSMREDIDDLSSALDTEIENRHTAEDSLTEAINTEATNRQAADATLQSNIDAESASRIEDVQELDDKITEETDAREASEAEIEDLIEEKADLDLLDKQVITAISVNDTPSTTSLKLDGSKENLLTGATSTDTISLPVASATQAGIMNVATFRAVQTNSDNINAILSGTVAIDNLPSEPTQLELSTAWTTATSIAEIINGAKIYDIANSKIWTYYENSTTWYSADASGSVTVSQWTNTALGIAKGSTVNGQIFAENDGTGSVNGWDNLVGSVADNTANIASLQSGKVDKVTGKQLSTEDYTSAEKDKLSGIEAGAEANVQSNWNQTDTTADDFIKNKPTIPVITVTSTDPGEGQQLPANNFIFVYED